MRWLAAALLVASAGALAADAPLRTKVEPVRVSARAYYVQGLPGMASAANEGFNSNAGFVVTDEGVVVVDALGTPPLGAALLAAIRKVTDKPVRRVIVTHYHADHFYGLQAFKDAGAEIWAHRGALEYLQSDEGPRRHAQRARDLFPWVDEKMPLVGADRWLEGDASFTLGGIRFDLVAMGPAHTPEDLVVSVPQEGLLFSGDILFTGRIPFVGEADSRKWLAAIERLATAKPKLMVPGHGVVSRDPAKDLGLTQGYLRHLRAVMGKAVEDFTPFEEAYAKADWSAYAKLPAFDAANRVNAYGQYLLLERELLKR